MAKCIRMSIASNIFSRVGRFEGEKKRSDKIKSAIKKVILKIIKEKKEKKREDRQLSDLNQQRVSKNSQTFS